MACLPCGVRVSSENDLLTSVVISTDKAINANEIYEFLRKNENIISIARQDDDF